MTRLASSRSKLWAALLLVVMIAGVRADEPVAPDHSCHEVLLQPVTDQCAYVKQYCMREAVGYINYLENYYCSSAPKQVAILIGASVWLVCLFMTIGIAASDFLCPNLNTMANILHLSESLVGVTFLAFGNGSPDVFSTLAAMKIGAGSLALGELLGAASFIAAVVTGSMALIRPFHVHKKSFMRDVLFFAVAVMFAMVFVADGTLEPWECVVMLVLYVLYVLFVVWWHWYRQRQRKHYIAETRARDWYTEPGQEHPHMLDTEEGEDAERFLENPDLEALTEDDSEEVEEETYNELTQFMRMNRRRASVSTDDTKSSQQQQHQRNNSAIRPSLFSALEFRSLIQNLQSSKSSNSSQIPMTEQEFDTINEAPSTQARLDIPQLIVTEYGSQEVYDALGINSATVSPRATSGRTSFDSDSQRTHQVLEPSIGGWHGPLLQLSTEHLLTLFPTMRHITKKPWHGVVSSVITAPSVLLLTLTVPVYETALHKDENTRLERIESLEEMTQIPRWLLFVQAILAPVTVGLFAYVPGSFHWIAYVASVAGVSIALMVLLYFVTPSSTIPPRPCIRLVSFLGFVIAISWVSTIANEVVGVLKLLGTVFKISDAILGLTVFAMGNSLGDFVANATVAKMGYPMMALSACFGGPMLNILVGVGVSCLVVLVQQGATMGVYHIDLSPSLIISGATLLITLMFLAIAVPLNRWEMSRWIGTSLIVFWGVATTINVVVELV